MKDSDALYSIAGQLMSSISTFAYSFYLAHELGISAFGLYSMGFSLAVFSAGASSALVATQMMALARKKSIAERFNYYNFMFKAQGLVILCLTLFGMIVSAILSGWLSFDLYIVFSGLICAILLSMREFLIRVYYDSGFEKWILYSSISQVMSLFGLIVISRPASSPVALLYLAASNVFGVVWGWWWLSRKLDEPRTLFSFSMLAGLHSLGAHFLSNMRAQGYVYLVGLLHGSQGVGILGYTRNFMMPMAVFVPAIIQRLSPQMVDIHHSHREMMGGFLWKNSLSISIVCGALFVLTCFGYHVASVYGLVRSDYLPYLLMWGAILFASCVRSIYEAALVAMAKFSDQSTVAGLSLGVMVASVVVFGVIFGLMGVLLGLLVAELVMLVATIYRVRNA